jgi:hypothetical protein
MKNSFLLLCFLFVILAKAQTINFPDVNFKTKLLAYGSAKNSTGTTMVIDTNNDGEIQVSEAINVYELDLWSSPLNNANDIVDISGIHYFQNLKKLNCIGNSLTSLNLMGMNNLEYVMSGNNDISSINLTGLVSLKDINISNNLLTSINIDNLTSLTTLYVFENHLSSLTFSNNPELETIWCSDNSIPTLDVASLSNLKYLYCQDNALTSINFGTTSAIRELICVNNNLTNLSITSFQQMTYLDFGSNQITTITFPITNTISSLNISDNPINTINLSALPLLYELYASGTLLTTLDCSQTVLQKITCNNNAFLQTIILKNNVVSYSEPDLLFYCFVIGNNPQLTTICVDDGEQNNLAYNNFSYNTSGAVIVYTGSTCSVVTHPGNFATSDFTKNLLVLYPNPVTTVVNISSEDSFNIKRVLLYTTLGQLVKTTTDSSTIDMTGLSAGTYYLSIESDSGITMQKVVKL